MKGRERNGMRRFKYEITMHEAERFKQLVFFCSETGECNLDKVPGDQKNVLQDILNERGVQGWDLVQLSFGTDGIMAFWKREL